MKKLFAIVLTLVMLAALAVPAMAAEGDTYTLTIINERPGHTYEAYQIFTGVLSTDESTLSNVEWGVSITDGDALLAALKADAQVGTTFSAAEDAADVASILGTVSNDSATLDRFAEIVGEYISDTPVATSGEQSEGAYEIEGLSAGYYLVKDQDGSQDGEHDFYTKYIVRIVKSAEVHVKGSTVTVDKTINDSLDGTYTEYESFDVNQDAFYKWEGTLPTNLRAYTNYYYKFVDTLPAGLTFVEIEQVYVEDQNGNVVHTWNDLSNVSTNTVLGTDNDSEEDAATLLDNITFTVQTLDNGTADDVSDDYQVVTLEFNDLLTHYNLLSTDKIIVKYRCFVDRDALIQEGNENEVYLIYDNNPNGEGRGQTPEDPAYAFTFEFSVDKYDQADSTRKLEGVEFLLYYRTHDGENTVLNYALVVTEEMIGQEVNGRVLTEDDLGLVYGWTTDKSAASVLDTDANGAFAVKGLDAGTYFLEEIKTVDGYNLLETPVQVDIIPTYTGEEMTGYTATVEYKVDSITQGSNGVVGIRNSKGSTLPSTGGIGTTIFYVMGAVLVIGASVLLITRKRMTNVE